MPLPIGQVFNDPRYQQSDLDGRLRAIDRWQNNYEREAFPEYTFPEQQELQQARARIDRIRARETLLWDVEHGSTFSRDKAARNLASLDLLASNPPKDAEEARARAVAYAQELTDSGAIEQAARIRNADRMARVGDVLADKQVTPFTRRNPAFFDSVIRKYGFESREQFDVAESDANIHNQKFDGLAAVDSNGQIVVKHHGVAQDIDAVGDAILELDAPAAEKRRVWQGLPEIRQRIGKSYAKLFNKSRAARKALPDGVDRYDAERALEALKGSEGRARSVGGVTIGAIRLAELEPNLELAIFGDAADDEIKEFSRQLREEREAIEGFTRGTGATSTLGGKVLFESFKALPELIPVARAGRAAGALFKTAKGARAGALGAALTTGAAQAGSSAFSESIAMGEPINKARAAALIQFGTTLLVSGAFSAVGAGGLEDVLAGVKSSAARKGLMDRLKAVGLQGGSEGVEEGVDEYVANLAIAVANQREGATQEELAEQALVAMLVGGLLGAGATAISETAEMTVKDQDLSTPIDPADLAASGEGALETIREVINDPKTDEETRKELEEVASELEAEASEEPAGGEPPSEPPSEEESPPAPGPAPTDPAPAPEPSEGDPAADPVRVVEEEKSREEDLADIEARIEELDAQEVRTDEEEMEMNQLISILIEETEATEQESITLPDLSASTILQTARQNFPKQFDAIIIEDADAEQQRITEGNSPSSEAARGASLVGSVLEMLREEGVVFPEGAVTGIEELLTQPDEEVPASSPEPAVDLLPPEDVPWPRPDWADLNDWAMDNAPELYEATRNLPDQFDALLPVWHAAGRPTEGFESALQSEEEALAEEELEEESEPSPEPELSEPEEQPEPVRDLDKPRKIESKVGDPNPARLEDQPTIFAITNDIGKIESRSAARRRLRKEGLKGKELENKIAGLYDGAPGGRNPTLSKLIYGGTVSPDEAAQSLGFGNDVSGMWAKVDSEIQTAKSLKGQKAQEEAAQKQAIDFFTAAQDEDLGKVRLDPSELVKGAKIVVDGEELVVAKVTTDDDGEVQEVALQGGERFGRQTVRPGQTLYVDSFEDVEVGEVGEFAPAKKPKLLPGENQGDLLDSTGEDSGFALVGQETSGEQFEAPDTRTQEEQDEEAGQGSLIGADMGRPTTGAVGFPGMPPVSTMRPVTPRPRTVRRISAPEVMEAIAAILKKAGGSAPFRVGRVPNKRYAGVFQVDPEVIRTARANDVPAAAHEMAHAIEKVVFGWPKGGPWTRGRIGSVRIAEILKLGKALYGNTNPTGGYKREGFAEFVRLYITDPAQAAKQAPEFLKWFESNFIPSTGTAKQFETARKQAERFYTQTAAQATQAATVGGETLDRRVQLAGRRLKDKVTDHIGVESLIEAGVALQDFFAEAQRKTRGRLSAKHDPFETFTERRLTHDAIAAWMAEHDMLDWARNPVGPSLKEALAPVRGQMTNFISYLYAKRSLAMHLEGRGRYPGISEQQSVDTIAELETPEFQTAARKLYSWQDGVLEYVAQSSPTLREAVEKMRKADPGNYIPLQREFQAFDKQLGGAASGNVAMGSVGQRLRGSGRRIKNPIESILSNTRGMILIAHQRHVLEQVLSISQNVEGMGDFMVRVPQDQEVALKQDAESLIEDLRKRVESLGGTLDLDDGGNDLASEMMLFMRPRLAPRAQGEVPILPVKEGDTITWYEMDPKLYHAVQGLDVKHFKGLAAVFLSTPTKTFRLGTTGLRATFSVVTNPARDAQTFALNSRSSVNAPMAMFEWTKMYGHAFAEAVTGGKISNEWIDMYRRLGGVMATSLGQDSRPVKRAARRLFERPAIRAVDPRNWLDYVREVFQFAEIASRATEMKLVAKEAGYSGGMLTAEQAQQILVAGKQVTTDFSAAGRWGAAINQAVPFFNAALQGPRAHLRAMRDHPVRFLARGGMMMAVAIGNWLRFKDEEWWQELRAGDRYRYTHIPVTINGRTEILRIPRPFEAGGVFMAFPEAMLDAWHYQDPKSATEWATEFVKHTVPGIEPVLLREAIDQVGNWDRFFDSPIVPVSLERAPAEEQFTGYTSKAAIEIGRIFGISPLRVDHAIKGIGGGAASDAVRLPDRIASILGGGTSREAEPADIPVFGTLFRTGGTGSTRSRSTAEFYEHLDFSLTREQSVRHPETEEEREIRLQMRDAARALSLISRTIREKVSVEERRKLGRLRNRIAREANEAFRADKIVRERFKAWHKEAERIAPKKK